MQEEGLEEKTTCYAITSTQATQLELLILSGFCASACTSARALSCASRAWKVAAYRKVALDTTNIADAAAQWALNPHSSGMVHIRNESRPHQVQQFAFGITVNQGRRSRPSAERRPGTLHCISSHLAQLHTVHPHPGSIDTMSDTEYTLYYWPGGHTFRGPDRCWAHGNHLHHVAHRHSWTRWAEGTARSYCDLCLLTEALYSVAPTQVNTFAL